MQVWANKQTNRHKIVENFIRNTPYRQFSNGNYRFRQSFVRDAAEIIQTNQRVKLFFVSSWCDKKKKRAHTPDLYRAKSRARENQNHKSQMNKSTKFSLMYCIVQRTTKIQFDLVLSVWARYVHFYPFGIWFRRSHLCSSKLLINVMHFQSDIYHALYFWKCRRLNPAILLQNIRI